MSRKSNHKCEHHPVNQLLLTDWDSTPNVKKESQHVHTKSASQHAVDEFFRALSKRDVSIASEVLTKETVEIIPPAMAGGTDPERIFDGKDAVLGYLQSILDNFEPAVLVDR